MRPTHVSAALAATHLVSAGFPIHSLSPAFFRKIFKNSDEPDPQTSLGLGDGLKSWIQNAWSESETLVQKAYEDASQIINNAAESISAHRSPTDSQETTSSPTTQAPQSTSSRTTEAVKEVIDEAEKRFRSIYLGWEDTMPSWTGTLSKLRCDKIYSFSSCAQHCFTLIPDFANVNNANDISEELVPLADDRAWWRPNIVDLKQFNQKGRLFGMSVSDFRDFKSCLYNVCITDYVTTDTTPGCIGADGEVSVLDTDHQKGNSAETKFDELDLYNPGKAEMYKRYGVFTLSRFLQSIMPECDLSSPSGCHLRPSYLLNFIVFLLMFGGPLTLAYFVSTWFSPLLGSGSANPEGPLSGRSWKDRVRFKLNKWLDRQERIVSAIWIRMINPGLLTPQNYNAFELVPADMD